MRTMVLAGVLLFLSAFLGGALAVSLMFPKLVEGQETGLRVDNVAVVDESGTHRVLLAAGGTFRSEVTVFATDGDRRVSIITGALDGSQPLNSGLYVFGPGGRAEGALARLRMDGTGIVELGLRDRQRQDRLLLQLDLDGNPSMRMLDANGGVIWSAP